MNLLLDTHIWYWLATDVSRLGKVVRLELTKPENEPWLSPISVWEMLLLRAKGRLRIIGDPEAWLARSTMGIREAPLTYGIAAAAAQLAMHKDPADRFLVATAQVLSLTLVTADKELLGLSNIRTMANR